MASANISFEKIPVSMRKPGAYLEWNNKLALRNLPTNQQKVVLIATHTASTLPALTDLANVFSEADVAATYGQGSQAHLMVRAALTAWPYATLSLITTADDAAGVAATATITFTGTATIQGVLRVGIANADVLQIGVKRTDTAASVATAVAAAINAQVDLPVTAAAAAGVVTLTAKNKGTDGNFIRISHSLTAAGLTAVATEFAGGDANPDIEPALTAIVAEGHDILAVGLNDAANLLKLRDHLEAVAAPQEKRWALGVYGQTASLATATTQALALNSEFMVNAWYRGTPSLPCEVAAAFAVVLASEEDPARPLNTLALAGIGVCPVADKTLRSEQENALYNGVTPLETSAEGTRVQIVRAITTYTKSVNGTADESFLDVTTVRTLIYVSKAVIQRFLLRHPRDKMTDRVIKLVRSDTLEVLLQCETLEIVENVEANKDKLIVERDMQNTGMLNMRLPTDVVNGLHILGVVVDLYL